MRILMSVHPSIHPSIIHLLPGISHFFTKFSIEFLYRKLSNKHEFHKYQVNDIQAAMNIYPYFIYL